MSVSITVKHHMSAGHRLPGLGKCDNLHGHTFGIEWRFNAPSMDAEEVEFIAIKKTVRGWVDDKLDHGYIVGEQDLALIEVLLGLGVKFYVTTTPPTTETIATEIAHATQRLLPNLQLMSVHVTEGPSNAATWTA